MTAWDAIVVGAGPAGCAAAYDLARAGCSVLLLDKSEFPRHKACAGGLTAKAVKALRYPIDSIARMAVQTIHLKLDRLSFPLSSRQPVCVMTIREEFDAYCLTQTIAAGAHFERMNGVKHIARDGQFVQLSTENATYRGRFLVGADGASGQVRRICGDGSWFCKGFALEVKTSMPADPVDLTFDFSFAGGYAWIFPKGDHLNVGIYSASSPGSVTRHALMQYMEQRCLSAREHVTGQYLGMGAGTEGAGRVREDLRDRVFLVGDAAGFVDALTGEGIYGAILSGQAAAAAILGDMNDAAPALEIFAGQLREYRQTLRFSTRAATAFYARPERGFRAMRLPFVRRTMVRTYTHGLNINSIAMRLARARC